jgi:hypothetical protein
LAIGQFDGINTSNLDSLKPLSEPEAGYAAEPGTLACGPSGVRQSLAVEQGSRCCRISGIRRDTPAKPQIGQIRED